MKTIMAVLMLTLLCSCGTATQEPTPEGPAAPDVSTSETAPVSSIAETLEIINLRGDVSLLYHMTDGSWQGMDGLAYTFDGLDTWTDANGAEWNQTLEADQANTSWITVENALTETISTMKLTCCDGENELASAEITSADGKSLGNAVLSLPLRAEDLPENSSDLSLKISITNEKGILFDAVQQPLSLTLGTDYVFLLTEENGSYTLQPQQ